MGDIVADDDQSDHHSDHDDHQSEHSADHDHPVGDHDDGTSL